MPRAMGPARFGQRGGGEAEDERDHDHRAGVGVALPEQWRAAVRSGGAKLRKEKTR